MADEVFVVRWVLPVWLVVPSGFVLLYDDGFLVGKDFSGKDAMGRFWIMLVAICNNVDGYRPQYVHEGFFAEGLLLSISVLLDRLCFQEIRTVVGETISLAVAI